MPVFHDLKCLFIHIPKNAGRSVEEALLRGQGSVAGGRRSVINRAGVAFARLTRPRRAENFLMGTLDVTLAAQHLTYLEIEILGLLSTDQLADYLSFAVVSNPFDRALSSVMHFTKTDLYQSDDEIRTRGDFERALATWLDIATVDHNITAHRRAQYDFVIDRRGRIALDQILHFEQLAPEFDRLMKSVGQMNMPMPWHGRSGRARPYLDYYNPAARSLVEKAYADDLEAFGYRFDDPKPVPDPLPGSLTATGCPA